jgi:hypothetical protein
MGGCAMNCRDEAALVKPIKGGFIGVFYIKRARIRTKPKKTGKNLWKPKKCD